jgi:two-component system C4-dicarboxylate transport response regulator DctD
VRELRNVAERCVLGIEAGSLCRRGQRPGAGLAQTVEAFERALIADALRRHGGSLARSAEALAVPKTTLHDKIRKYGLDQTGI